MNWVLSIVALLILLGLTILFLNRFYRKATREVALVRTGMGGQRVVMDGGCIALPFLHNVAEVNMKTMRLEVARAGDRSVITEDRLRVDMVVEVYVRVDPSPEGIATAAQALAGKAFRAGELADMIEGKLVDAMLATAARHTMDSLHESRGQYVGEIAELLRDNLAQNGLAVESVSLTRLDQTPFQALEENNAFNAVGMRRLAEVIAANKKQRAAIEADADVSVRQSQLEAVKRKLIIEQEEEEAQINQRMEIEKRKADSAAEIAERQAESDRRSEQARISQEQTVRESEIGRDRALRRLEMESSLGTEMRKRDNAIALAKKQAEESKALAEAEAARTEEVVAQESVQTEKDRAVAQRAREIALIRAQEQAEVDETRTKGESGTIVDKARAESEAQNLRAEAMKAEMLAESAGKAALIEAENSQSDPVIRMKLDMHRLNKLPELVGQMMKPVEKIDSIRINQISGFGGAGGGGDGTGGDKPLVNQAVDSILGMALQMPAIRRLGEEIGINIGDGLEGVADSAEAQSKATGGDAEEPEDAEDS